MTESENKTSILLVDDEAFIVNLAVRALAGLGYSDVDTANNGQVALGKLISQDRPYDIIICDLNMPEMDGIEFIRHASQSGFAGGIIFLSGEDKRVLNTVLGFARVQNLYVLGALTKPLNPGALKGLLSEFKPVKSEKRTAGRQQSITEADLKAGIRGSADNQLLLVYQPKIHLASGRITGVETLARWWNLEQGALGPAAFIPLAERCGLIDELTNEIYKKALEQVVAWERLGYSLRTAINFSVNSFNDPEFCDFLINTATRSNLNPEQILLEVTETQAITLPVDCMGALMKLRLKRFGLSIDDFGTGNSSMAQLKNIPFTELKIDRAFVNGAAEDISANAILKASVDLGKSLGMEIVAEGVETKEDLELVKSVGCDYVQGFYFAKPMRSEDLVKFLEDWR